MLCTRCELTQQSTDYNLFQPPAFDPVDIGPLVSFSGLDDINVLPAFNPTNADLNLLPAVDNGNDWGLPDDTIEECVDPSEAAPTRQRDDSTTAGSGDRASQIELEKVNDFARFDYPLHEAGDFTGFDFEDW
jgi:hypothetical protein